LLFNPGPAIEAASLIIKKTVPFGVVSYEVLVLALTFLSPET
jgi:hypothetical protein